MHRAVFGRLFGSRPTIASVTTNRSITMADADPQAEGSAVASMQDDFDQNDGNVMGDGGASDMHQSDGDLDQDDQHVGAGVLSPAQIAARHYKQKWEELQAKQVKSLSRNLPALAKFSGTGTGLTRNWSEYRVLVGKRIEFEEVPAERQLDYLVFHLDGPALQHYVANQDTILDVNQLDHAFLTGPFGTAVTDFGARAKYRGEVRIDTPGHVHNVIRNVDKDSSQAPTPFTDVEKITAVQFAMSDEIRSKFMSDGNGKPFTVWADFSTFALNVASSMGESSGASKRRASGDQQQPLKRRSFGSSNLPHRPTSRPNNTTGNTNGNGNGNGNNGNNNRTCRGCGSPNHLVTDFKDGRPVCRNYDPNKAGKGKGKGKAHPFGKRA